MLNSAQTFEISLRIPSLRVRRDGKEGLDTIANSDVRFVTRLELPVVPKPGDMLPMTVTSGEPFECEVIRKDWHDAKNMFVVTCRYANRSISATQYYALLHAPEWQVVPLL